MDCGAALRGGGAELCGSADALRARAHHPDGFENGRPRLRERREYFPHRLHDCLSDFRSHRGQDRHARRDGVVRRVVVGGEYAHRRVAGRKIVERISFPARPGRSGHWPAASKAVSEWFPAKERALAIGVYTMGATIGATVAPYLVIPLATHAYHETMPAVANWLGHGTGWRIAFIVTGCAGLVWLIPWLLFYRQPRESKQITTSELKLIEESAATENPADTLAANAWSWKQVFLFRGTWLLLLGRLITDPVWYFYQFWFPKYLSADRHLSQDQLKITWIIYAAAGVGSLLGGWLSRYSSLPCDAPSMAASASAGAGW